VTSRYPGNLDALVAKIVEEVEEGRISVASDPPTDAFLPTILVGNVLLGGTRG
jgi:hypothetical protein